MDRYCPTTRRGVSLLGISEGAQSLGFHTRGARFTLRQLKDAGLPSILYWDQRHFVVLYKVRKNRYYVADPGRGLMTYSEQEFKEHWISSQKDGFERGIALTLSPTSHFTKSAEKPDRIISNPFRIITSYLSTYRHHLWLIATGLLLACVLQLILPFLTQCIVDIGIKRRDISFIWLILAGELAIVAGRTATDFIRRLLLAHISVRVNVSLISDFFIKLLKLPMVFFETRNMGDLMQRMDDHSRIQNFLTENLLSIMFTMLSFLVFGIVLCIYNRLIFCIFIIGTVLYVGWTLMFLRRRKAIDIALFEKRSENKTKTFEFITTLQETKLQDCCQRRRWEWEDVQADLFAIQLKALRLSQTQEAGSIFINEIQNVVITVLAAGAVINGSITLGAMLAIQYITGQLNSPVARFIQFIQSLQDVRLSLDRINEVRRREDEDCHAILSVDTSAAKGIRVSNLTFRYEKSAPTPVIDNISVIFPAGKTTAIVGESGSGKTTLMKLLLGFFPDYEGDIEIEGSELRKVHLKQWRRKCGVVMQDGVIFTESIARNIAIDDADINPRRLEEAARMACIYDFINSLPLKFETIIGPNGIGISQGQRQRILIARAIYRNPEYIILDEATNSLDTVNERAIVANLSRFFQNKTVIVIAHRLSTVRNADNIVVMQRGRIVESGSHSQLSKANGDYYNLIRNQLELGS